MNFTTTMGFTAGLLQFFVAGYALRLNRLFGVRRVGWSLFWAFLLLAVLHLAQSFMHGASGEEFLVKVDVMNTLISMLLLIGMVHLEALLQERNRVEREQVRMRGELESEVKKKTAYLTRALEELQAEIDERKRLEADAQTTQWELEVVSRRADTSRAAEAVHQCLDEMLESVNNSANLVSSQLKQIKIANVVRTGALLREHTHDLQEFLTLDPKGQNLTLYIAQLAQHLSREQIDLLGELDSLKENLKKLTVIQQEQAHCGRHMDSVSTAEIIPNLSSTKTAVAA